MKHLALSRLQILAFRRSTGALDRRLGASQESLRTAAFAGLQDSMPRAALLSLHARIEATTRDVWEDERLVQLWGPRFNVYAVAADDIAVFALGTMPGDARGMARAHDLAARLSDQLAGKAMPYDDVGLAMGLNPNALRYAAATGTVLIRWVGAGRTLVWVTSPPDMDAVEARLELARRYLHVFGPATPESFGRWAGIGAHESKTAFDRLGAELITVWTPVGLSWLLAADEPAARAEAPQPNAVRLLPSGDAYYLAWGRDRELIVGEEARREELWTSRVWPGALLVNGEIEGTWRRAGANLVVRPWSALTATGRDAVVAEAESLPLPALGPKPISVRFEA